MSADLTCPECKGTDHYFANRDFHGTCFGCNGTGRRRPELHEWDALKAECDQLLATIRESCADNRDLMLAEGRTAMCPLAHEMMYERDRYEKALQRIANAGPEYARRSYSLVAIARAALDPEGGETS